MTWQTLALTFYLCIERWDECSPGDDEYYDAYGVNKDQWVTLIEITVEMMILLVIVVLVVMCNALT